MSIIKKTSNKMLNSKSDHRVWAKMWCVCVCVCVSVRVCVCALVACSYIYLYVGVCALEVDFILNYPKLLSEQE